MSLEVNIEKRLGSIHLQVSFSADPGCLAILGLSGCGKSMTLKCIAGIETPDSGRIVLDGRVLYDSQAHIDVPPQKRQIGYLFQEYALFPHMTVAQNIYAATVGADRHGRTEKTRQVLQRFQLEDLAYRKPHQLSGGQKQRTALARIIASEPKVILLDEPLSALDSSMKQDMEITLEEDLSSFSGTLLWVTHDLSEAYRHCHRVCILDNGQSLKVTSLDHLLNAPETVSAAKIVGCSNFIPCQITPNGITVPAWSMFIPMDVPQPDVKILGVPSKSLSLSGSGIPLPCQVLRMIRTLPDPTWLVRPVSASKACPPLQITCDCSHNYLPGDTLFFSLDPDKIYLLDH